MRHAPRIILSAAIFLVMSFTAHAQVTTSTLVGLVRDTSNAVIPGATVIATLISVDGRSNWLEGAQLISVYFMIGLAFYFVP